MELWSHDSGTEWKASRHLPWWGQTLCHCPWTWPHGGVLRWASPTGKDVLVPFVRKLDLDFWRTNLSIFTFKIIGQYFISFIHKRLFFFFFYFTLTGDRVIISPDPRGKIRAWAIISRTLVFPALWSPTTTTWDKDIIKIMVMIITTRTIISKKKKTFIKCYYICNSFWMNK